MTGTHLASIRIDALMALSAGDNAVAVAILDGPVAANHPDFTGSRIRAVGATASTGCADPSGVACRHGTFVAGVLVARREAATPGICPGCTLLVRPIFSDPGRGGVDGTAITPGELAAAIADSVDAGARVVNVSGAIARPRVGEERDLRGVLDEACRRGVIVTAAAGNEMSVGGSAITSHPWVVAVVPYGRDRRPMTPANLGRSIGRHGIAAPGEKVSGVDPAGTTVEMSGSSAAAPLVAGTAALLWSLVPSATAPEVRVALTHAGGGVRRTIVPPLLDAWASYQALAGSTGAPPV